MKSIHGKWIPSRSTGIAKQSSLKKDDGEKTSMHLFVHHRSDEEHWGVLSVMHFMQLCFGFYSDLTLWCYNH